MSVIEHIKLYVDIIQPPFRNNVGVSLLLNMAKGHLPVAKGSVLFPCSAADKPRHYSGMEVVLVMHGT